MTYQRLMIGVPVRCVAIGGILLALFCFVPCLVQGVTWVTMPRPAPEVKTALSTLIDGDNLWVGFANHGLVCFDNAAQIKVNLTVKEGLPGPNVTCLVMREKDLWIGTSDGLVKRDEGGTLKVFTTDAGLPDNGITAMTVRDKTLWVGTMKGLCEYRGERLDLLPEDRGLPALHITALGSDEDGLLIGTTKGWATLRSGTIEAHTPERDGLPFEWITSVAYFKHAVSAMASGTSTSEDWYCLGTAGGGLLLYRGGTYQQIRAEEANGPGMDWVTCMRYEPVNKELWVGGNGGLAIWNIEAGIWKRYNSQNSGLISDMVKDLSVETIDTSVTDYEILKGFGQECKCASCAAELHNKNPKPCKECWKIPETLKPRKLPRTQTWAGIATQEGANLLYDKKLQHVGQGHIYCYLTNLGRKVVGLGVGDRIWAAINPAITGTYLYEFVPSVLRFDHWSNIAPETRFPNDINTLTCDYAGNPALGARKAGLGGLAILKYTTDQWEFWNEAQGLNTLDVSCLFKHGADLYIGTGQDKVGGNVYRLRDGKIETFPRTQLAMGSTKNFLFRYSVTSIAADDEHLFVGTCGGGIFYLDGGTWKRFDSLTDKWLSSNEIDCLAWRNGVLYVGTKSGLDCFSWKSGTMHVDVTKAFGCQSNEVQALLWDDTDGDGGNLILWMATKYGVTRICRTPMLLAPPAKSRYVGKGHLIWPNGTVIPFTGAPTPDDGFGPAWGETYVGNPKFSDLAGGIDICPFDGHPGENIKMMTFDDFNLWIATDNGLCRFRK